MAIITTLFTPEPQRLPLIAPVGEPDIWWSNYPKAEIIFNVNNNTSLNIDALVGGDNQKIQIKCLLPPTFAYILTDITMVIFGMDYDEWDDSCFMFLTSTASSPWTMFPEFSSTHAVSGSPGINQYKTYSLKVEPPSVTFLGTSAGGGITLNLNNNVVDGAAGGVTFFARFLQYDLNQGYRTSINAPVLTR